MRRVADAQAIEAKGAVSGSSSNIDIAVVVVVVGEIPVSAASQYAMPSRLRMTHVLSKPMPWVRTCTVGLVLLLLSGWQNLALIS